MENEQRFGRVPSSITFGTRVMEIPTLEEMGIPIAGLTYVTPAQGLTLAPDACWVNRGDVLVTYEVSFFIGDTAPRGWFQKDRLENMKFMIRSPISGLLLDYRVERTADWEWGVPHSFITKYCLPVLLIPNDEPPPSADSFYVYDKISNVAAEVFHRLPRRNRNATGLQRLKDWISWNPNDSAWFYESRNTLKSRTNDAFRTHRIHEIGGDNPLLSRVQDLRGQDLALREKLVHIARAFGQSC
jgi:hypothetical protein